MQASDKRGGGFAGRLAAARRLATKLDEPSVRVEKLATQWAADLVKIDPAILTMLRLAEEDPEERESEEVKEFFEGLRRIVHASRGAGAGAAQLVKNLETVAQMSRELRKPVRRVQDALRKLLDGIAVMEEWERQIDRVEGAG